MPEIKSSQKTEYTWEVEFSEDEITEILRQYVEEHCPDIPRNIPMDFHGIEGDSVTVIFRNTTWVGA